MEVSVVSLRKRKRKRNTVKAVFIVLWLCLVITFPTACIAAGQDLVAHSFTLEGKPDLLYWPANYEDLSRFRLVSPDDNVIPLYQDTEDELGSLMGTVGYSEKTSWIGKSVYHAAAWPESRAICILDKGDSHYAYYIAYGYRVEISEGESSFILFEKFELPEKGVSVEIQDTDEKLVFSTTDKDTIAELCALFSGSDNTGPNLYDREEDTEEVSLTFETEEGLYAHLSYEPSNGVFDIEGRIFTVDDAVRERFLEIIGKGRSENDVRTGNQPITAIRYPSE